MATRTRTPDGQETAKDSTPLPGRKRSRHGDFGDREETMNAEPTRACRSLRALALLFAQEGDYQVKKYEVRGWIEETGVIASVRVYTEEDALFAAETVAGQGIPVVEVTLTVPHATKVISHLVKNTPHIVVGAGGVTNADVARQCLDAGDSVLHQRWTASDINRVCGKRGRRRVPGSTDSHRGSRRVGIAC